MSPLPIRRMLRLLSAMVIQGPHGGGLVHLVADEESDQPGPDRRTPAPLGRRR
ncbi:MAG: hypothetical protein JWM47_1919 [Acidimicrobiales bacterium]|nr:hypothetical protein [Acidimicrobiales bacterium]